MYTPSSWELSTTEELYHSRQCKGVEKKGNTSIRGGRLAWANEKKGSQKNKTEVVYTTINTTVVSLFMVLGAVVVFAINQFGYLTTSFIPPFFGSNQIRSPNLHYFAQIV